MTKLFEELDYCPTDIGALSLRKRFEPKTAAYVFEIKLGEEFLMSSMFSASEEALADLGLAPLSGKLDVVVGGLGLGYTARQVLINQQVQTLVVIDALKPVIEWHETGLLPLGKELTADPRCKFRHADFFQLAMSEKGFGGKKHAILVDIDHEPDFLLDAANAEFYTLQGLSKMAHHLHPGGIFGLWSDGLPDEKFIAHLDEIFSKSWAEPVTFHNPLQNCDFTQTVYFAQT